jgi:hypothetical protein
MELTPPTFNHTPAASGVKSSVDRAPAFDTLPARFNGFSDRKTSRY